MNYPQELNPTSNEIFRLSTDKSITVPKAMPRYKMWIGDTPEDDYGGKAFLDFGEPLFAELGILRSFQNIGWDGVWVDTYRKRFLIDWTIQKNVKLPEKIQSTFDEICAVGKSKSGCWDVFCWKSDDIVFAELKRHANDNIRNTQINWLEAALKCGLKPESFLVVEWTLV
ncbi:MAG: hypothetical protein WKF92_13730 [Pyrinomonadaceae bacterium]